ncbi:MAG: branched-chain amino acid ABC transporter permease [Caldilineaceae bacterium]|nr:branched-chain amino acid ABC transporter permease [Caldilineaceae bacterium]MCB9139066.1 branched-chain amino acid ABC transporter permease [Caldilineaceae bacterium]
MKKWLQPGLWIPLLLVAAFAAYPAITGSASARETMFTMIMSIGLASSLNILLGYTGYVSFGHIVFFGLGGYLGFWAIDELGWHLAPAVLLGGVTAGLLALLLGLAILRLRGAYFALATIGVNEAMKSLVMNLPFLGAATGMELNFSVYKSYGGPATALWMVYWSLAAIVLIITVVSYAVKKSKFGLGLMAIREDEDAAGIMGVVSSRAKTWAYVLSAVFPGMIGVLFFFKNGIIEPGSAFRLNLSIELLVMVMLGGAGTVLGPILGGAFYQRLRGLLLTSDLFKNIQLAVAGLLLLLIVLFIPSGAVGWLRERSDRLRRVLE